MTEQNQVAVAPEQKSLIVQFADKYSVDPKKLLNTLKATCFNTKEAITDEQMMALLVVADQYNLNPFTKEIYAYPDKGKIVPVVGVDGWSRIINSHPNLDGIEFVYSEATKVHKGKMVHEFIDCIIHRKDRSVPTKVREYFDEVLRVSDYKSPWDSHPHRMHRHKALIQCARIAFGFAGIFDEDEGLRIVEAPKHEKIKAQNETLDALNGKAKPEIPEIIDADFAEVDSPPEKELCQICNGRGLLENLDGDKEPCECQKLI